MCGTKTQPCWFVGQISPGGEGGGYNFRPSAIVSAQAVSTQIIMEFHHSGQAWLLTPCNRPQSLFLDKL